MSILISCFFFVLILLNLQLSTLVSFCDKNLGNQVEDEERERVGARRSPSPGMQVYLVDAVVVGVGGGRG